MATVRRVWDAMVNHLDCVLIDVAFVVEIMNVTVVTG
jgi:hypothetical protein